MLAINLVAIAVPIMMVAAYVLYTFCAVSGRAQKRTESNVEPVEHCVIVEFFGGPHDGEFELLPSDVTGLCAFILHPCGDCHLFCAYVRTRPRGALFVSSEVSKEAAIMAAEHYAGLLALAREK